MNLKEAKMQIGKNGLTQGVIETLDTFLKNNKQVRISVLKSSGRDRTKMREMVNILASKMQTPCDYKIIGFTIIVRRRLSRLKAK